MGTVFQPMITYEPPPTYHTTGKFTAAFQDIVDAYGELRSMCVCESELMTWIGCSAFGEPP